MTHGFVQEGFRVIAGIDADPSCRYAYERNNRGAGFIEAYLEQMRASDIARLYPEGDLKILVGCAPCQPFSKYALRYVKAQRQDEKWKLVGVFGKLIEEIRPQIVSMENVPELQEHRVFKRFVATLESEGYHLWYDIVDCVDYGVPQTRQRLVLLGSRFGEISLIPKTHRKPKTVAKTIGHLRAIGAGGHDTRDPLHRASGLSDLNLHRLQNTPEGGGWRDWPHHLILECHKKETGRSYGSIYGRMWWQKPAPTITTEFHGIGSGRFGHPDQDRAISLREGALLQTFPRRYRFVEDEDFSIGTLARHIGNAVPVRLARIVARSIAQHLELYL
jgi:DNA (cytosine-5)-methyltransferase 1